MAAKQRVDQLLVTRGLAENRTRAQALILAGTVYAGEIRLDKPGHQIAEDIDIEVRGRPHPWVSRGGIKLAHGLERFSLSVAGKICVDIGSSTGGFTDVLLQNGAARVYAVDVGRGQLDWKLRNDDRVVVLEGVNARHLNESNVSKAASIVVCDASFIGLRTVLPPALNMAAPEAALIALIKPQFEVGKGRVGKGGVVRDESLHEEVCQTIRDWLTDDMEWEVGGIEKSPITGPKGNIEFLIYATRRP
ncbi:MAG: TlyA family rRNA (cytidine-2'-O)-methyltransferase [Rhodospirillaceae bacterium]|nr:TlyA family rRNA (cytidine-2'-O)-methyltransferase [Rhodospirillaceae bacterium]|tara:strand:- start:3786 stop:4529 length:744 start_codon:yes stop_codon:yes gene_type:complete